MPAPVSTSSRRICIIASRFNQQLVEQLVQGAQACLVQHGHTEAQVYWVSGAFELPVLAARLLATKQVDGLIALGAVIRGATPHFDYVCQGVTQGLMQLMTRHAVPIGYGVIMTNTSEQAQARASAKILNAAADHTALQQESNKGYEAADAVLSLLATFNHLANEGKA